VGLSPARSAQQPWARGGWPKRRRRILGLWDECSVDRIGDEARKLVERLVREHLPHGSPQAFSEEELGRFNAGRQGQPVFAPYDRG
jgi:hypothetical protein